MTINVASSTAAVIHISFTISSAGDDREQKRAPVGSYR